MRNSDSDHLYKLKTYDLKGKLKFEKYIDFEYDNIYSAQKEIIVSGGDDCTIIRTNGRYKYNGKLSGKIESVVPSGNRLEYVVVYEGNTDIIRLCSEIQANNGKEAGDDVEINTDSGQNSEDNVPDNIDTSTEHEPADTASSGDSVPSE